MLKHWKWRLESWQSFCKKVHHQNRSMWYWASEVVDYLQCTVQLKAKRNKRRPKTTWHRTEEKELRWVGKGRVGEALLLPCVLPWNDRQQTSKVVDGYCSWYNKFTYLLPFFAGVIFPTKTLATISWPVHNRNSQGSTKNSGETSRIHSLQSVFLT